VKQLAICTSVHHAGDARVTYREGRLLARYFDATLWLLEDGEDSEVDAGDGRVLRIRRLGRPSSRAARMLAGRRRLIDAALAERPDVVLGHDPEVLPELARLSRRGEVATAYDMHEDYPSMMADKPWIPGPLRPGASGYVERSERASLPAVSVVAVADTFLERKVAHLRPGPVLVRNYPPLDLFGPGPRASERPPVIAYVGGLTAVRGSRVMIEAFGLVRQRIPDAELLLIGPVQDGSLGEAPRGVRMLGRVPYDEIGGHLAGARVGLATLADTPKHRHNIPSKLFDYMASGVPFVTSDFENIREACGEQGGVFVQPDDARAVADAILRLLRDDEQADELADEGLAAVRSTYNFDTDGAHLVQALLGAADSINPPG
jgi:glycosyltransferase involved in cell wall biosynthesis